MGRIDGWMSSCIWLKHDANATQQKWIAHSIVVCLDINHGFSIQIKRRKKRRENNK